MAFSDPQTVTIDVTPFTLNRIKSDGYRSEYAAADGTVKLIVSHQESKNRTRRMARLDQQVVAADPLTAENESKTLGVYLVIDEPDFGFSDTEVDDVVQALATWLSAANVAKICGNEH